jgi:hypothetical protein
MARGAPLSPLSRPRALPALAAPLRAAAGLLATRPRLAAAAAAGALLGAVLLLAAAAGAQHPIGPRTRPLHTRLALADAVALASVAEVSEGRIRLERARSLAGNVPESFEVKRSPAAPPPLAAGDRALLLLRGARPPYVLVDQPEETIRLGDAASEERWAEAALAWLEVRERPAAWVPLYLGWIEEGPDTLRDLAVQGLADPRAPFQPVDASVFVGLARIAWDPARPVAARRAAALLASFAPAGGAELSAGLLAAPLDCDPEVAQAALRAAPRQLGADPAPALMRGLDHADAEVRRVALQNAGTVTTRSPELRARIERVAREDAESWLRADAERALAAMQH